MTAKQVIGVSSVPIQLVLIGLIKHCSQTFLFTDSYVTSPEIQSLAAHLKNSLLHTPAPVPDIDPRLALTHETHTYYPQMLDWITNEIAALNQ